MTNTTAILTPADIKLVNCNDEWTELKQYKLINRETGEQIGWVTGHSGGTTFGTYAEWTAKIDATDTEDARFFDHSTRKGAIAGLLTAAQIPADDTEWCECQNGGEFPCFCDMDDDDDTDVVVTPTNIIRYHATGNDTFDITVGNVTIGTVERDGIVGVWAAIPNSNTSARFPGSTKEIAGAKIAKYLGLDITEQDPAELAMTKVVMEKAKLAFYLTAGLDTDAITQQFWGALECLVEYGKAKSNVETNHSEILSYLREFDWDIDAAAEAYVG